MAHAEVSFLGNTKVDDGTLHARVGRGGMTGT